MWTAVCTPWVACPDRNREATSADGTNPCGAHQQGEKVGMSTVREEIAAFVTSILAKFLDGEIEGDIDWETPVGADGLGIESIGILEVVVQLEREYEMSLSDEAIERMVSSTFGVLVDEVVAHHPATAASESRVG